MKVGGGGVSRNGRSEVMKVGRRGGEGSAEMGGLRS